MYTNRECILNIITNTMNKNTYSVLVVTYNRINKLKKCIECIEAQTIAPDRIIIINNNSNDGTKEYLDDISQRDTRYNVVHMESNVGGAGGFEQGVREFEQSGIQWLLMIDDDAMLQPDYIRSIDERIVHDDATEKYLAYAGAVYENGKLALNHRRILTKGCINREYPVGTDYYKKDVFECDQATFCGLVVNRKTVSAIGSPRGDFFIWYDDTEYSMRIRSIGEIYVVPKAFIIHECVNPEGGNNIAVFTRFKEKEYYGVRNRLIVSKQYYSRMTTLYMIFFIWLRIIKQLLWKITTMNNHDNKESADYNINLLKKACKDGVSGKTDKFANT